MSNSSILLTGAAVAVFAIGLLILIGIKSSLGNRAPALAIVLAAAVVAATLLFGPPLLGVNRIPTAGLLFVATFLGYVSVQPAPSSTRSICIGLSLAVGTLAMASALMAELLVASVAAGICGYLLYLGRHIERARRHGKDAT